ncbi:DMT family transporter [Deinococcus sp. Arct2-2]|uniref:DMT family transporter n=1 Tax=Deinococcus sp. Arct2-2 TaxID=2568653 RepID=UPI003211D54B
MTLRLTTPTLLSWRRGLAALLPFALGFGRLPLRMRAELFPLSAIYTASTVPYFMALARISASTAALLVYIAPACVLLYGLLARVRPLRWQTGALLCTLTGRGVAERCRPRSYRSAAGPDQWRPVRRIAVRQRPTGPHGLPPYRGGAPLLCAPPLLRC